MDQGVVMQWMTLIGAVGMSLVTGCYTIARTWKKMKKGDDNKPGIKTSEFALVVIDSLKNLALIFQGGGF